MSVKELWRGRRFFTQSYPLQGVKTTGTAPVVIDLLKQGLSDTLDTLSVHLTGNCVVATGGGGTATNQYNPEGLLVLATLSSAPQAAGLIPINALSSRAAVIDRAVLQGAFQRYTAIPDTTGTQPVDVWYHFSFKRDGARKGIEYAHSLKYWRSDTFTLVFGTRDTCFTGGTGTWDLSSVQVELWADMDVDANPDNIHAVEVFEQIFPISATNTDFQINQLPQGTFYDNLILVTENSTGLVDTILNNVDVEGGGRFWLNKGEANAKFIRDRYTRPLFYDPTAQTNLTGIYVLPLRDGMWSRALDAVATPILLKLDVTATGTLPTVRLIGRKLVPGAIRKTIQTAQGKQIIGLPLV